MFLNFLKNLHNVTMINRGVNCCFKVKLIVVYENTAISRENILKYYLFPTRYSTAANMFLNLQKNLQNVNMVKCDANCNQRVNTYI